jgi:hypothetical protein
MKNLIAFVSFAAFAAFALFQFSFEVSISMVFVAGFAAIAVRDYARTRRLSFASANRAVAPKPRSERLGLAA